VKICHIVSINTKQVEKVLNVKVNAASFQKMPYEYNVFLLPTPSKRPPKCQTMAYMPNKIFSCQTDFEKAKFMEFGIKNDRLATLIAWSRLPVVANDFQCYACFSHERQIVAGPF